MLSSSFFKFGRYFDWERGTAFATHGCDVDADGSYANTPIKARRYLGSSLVSMHVWEYHKESDKFFYHLEGISIFGTLKNRFSMFRKFVWKTVSIFFV